MTRRTVMTCCRPIPSICAPLRLTVGLATSPTTGRISPALRSRARRRDKPRRDAYGLGIEDCGRHYETGARDFFVGHQWQGGRPPARAYAPGGHRSSAFSGIWPGQEETFFQNDLVPVLASEEQLAFWMSVLSERGPYPCALQVDTGFVAAADAFCRGSTGAREDVSRRRL